MVGFWFLEVTSLLYIVMTLNFFISGHMLPLDLLPQPWSGILKALPFQYMAYFPAVVFLGKVTGIDLAVGLLAELLWAGFFIAAGAVALPAGLAALQRVRGLIEMADPLALHPAPRPARPLHARAASWRSGGTSWSRSRSRCSGWGSCWRSTRRSSRKTSRVADWTEDQYLFFVGCFFALNGLIECLFLENCNEFAELVRTGDLDFLLLKPIDEQFLISCRRVDWATAPNVLMGAAVMLIALYRMDWAFDPVRAVAFVVTFACGLLIAYSFMLVLTALSVWMVRNQCLMEMWWLFSSLARYPKQIFDGTEAAPLGLPLHVRPADPAGRRTFPAVTMVRTLDRGMVAFTLVATVVCLWASRRFFPHALRSYRSASS